MRKLTNRSNCQTNILVNVSFFKEPLTSCPGNLRWKMLHSVAHKLSDTGGKQSQNTQKRGNVHLFVIFQVLSSLFLSCQSFQSPQFKYQRSETGYPFENYAELKKQTFPFPVALSFSQYHKGANPLVFQSQTRSLSVRVQSSVCRCRLCCVLYLALSPLPPY